MRISNRKAIQDIVPTKFVTEDGREFTVQKIVGAREDPNAEIPFVAMTWGEPTPDPGFQFIDKELNTVRVQGLVAQQGGAIDSFNFINDINETIEFTFTANTQFIEKIGIYTDQIGAGNRLRLTLMKYENEKWITLRSMWKWNHSVDLKNYTYFVVGQSIRRDTLVKVVISIWDFDNKGAYLKLGANQGNTLYKVYGENGLRKRFGRVERISLDFLLTLGDIGLLGGTKISSTDQAWTIYQQIQNDAWERWDAVIVGGSVDVISGLRKTGSAGEETNWNFTIEFRFEQGTLSQQETIPIERVNLTNIYLSTENEN